MYYESQRPTLIYIFAKQTHRDMKTVSMRRGQFPPIHTSMETKIPLKSSTAVKHIIKFQRRHSKKMRHISLSKHKKGLNA